MLRRTTTRCSPPLAAAAGMALSLAAVAHAQQAQPSPAPGRSGQATAAQADRWVQLGGSANRYEDYLDKESLRRTGAKVTLWTRRHFARDRGTAWNELEFDCSMRTETILAYIRDEGGIISHNAVRPHREASPIAAASAEERIFNIACR